MFVFTSDWEGDARLYGIREGSSDSDEIAAGEVRDPLFSRKGDRLAYVSTEGGRTDIRVMDADGRSARRLTGDVVNDPGHPSWSPDGKRIAFDADVDGTRQIFTMQSDGKQIEQITNGSSDSYSPSWSPTQERIAFASTSGEQSILNIANATGDDVSELWSGQGKITSVSWLEDGSRIAWSFNSDSVHAIILTDPAGAANSALLSWPDEIGRVNCRAEVVFFAGRTTDARWDVFYSSLDLAKVAESMGGRGSDETAVDLRP